MGYISLWRYLHDYFLVDVHPSVNYSASEQILAGAGSLDDWHIVIFITHLKGRCQKNLSGIDAVKNFQ